MAANAFYEFRNWHRDPDCVLMAVPCGWASGVMLVCLECGCASELEALGGRSTLLETAMTRTAITAHGADGARGIQAGVGP